VSQALTRRWLGNEGYFRYEDTDVELLCHTDHTIAKNKTTQRIYQIETSALPEGIAWKPARSAVSDSLMTAYLSCFTLLLGANLVAAFVLRPTLKVSSLDGSGWAILLGYTVLQLAAHEASHIATFRAFGRRPDRVGFKLNFGVFPAVYVRMNDSHLLLPREKFIVHSAGLLANSLIASVFIAANWCIQSDPATLAASVFAFGLWANSMPILRSDGHKSLLALLDIVERRKLRDNPKLVIWLYTASWVVAGFLSLVALNRLI